MADAPATHQPPPPPSTTTHSASDPQVLFESKAEDAETRAAREELKQTVISDKQDLTSLAASDRHSHDMTLPGSGDNTPDLASAPSTLAAPAEGQRSEKRASSPKKKRAHDQVDQQRDEDGHRVSSGTDTESWVMVDGDEKEAKQSSSSEPQKKRARDETSPPVETLKSTAPVRPAVYARVCMMHSLFPSERSFRSLVCMLNQCLCSPCNRLQRRWEPSTQMMPQKIPNNHRHLHPLSLPLDFPNSHLRPHHLSLR